MSPASVASRFEELSAGRCGDPFDVLGPHRERGGVVVRVFAPAARRVLLLGGGDALEMTRVHDGGGFEIFLEDRALPLAYRLRIVGPDGEAREVDDPYRFGPVHLR